MKSLTNVLIASIMLSSLWAMASDEEPGRLKIEQSCPVPNLEYQRVISELKAIKTQIGDARSCPNLLTDLDKLSALADSKETVEINDLVQQAMSDQSVELDVTQIENIKNHAEKTSEVVYAVLKQLQRDNDCTKKLNKVETLNTLLSTTNHITSVLGGITGPYNIAINAGLSAFAGVVKGVNNIMGRKDSKFDFEQPAHRDLFTKNFCHYNRLRLQWTYLVNPRTRHQNIDKMIDYMNVKLKTLTEGKDPDTDYLGCPECQDFHQRYLKHVHIKKKIQSVKREMFLNGYTLGFENRGVERCFEIQDAVTNPRSMLMKMTDIYRNYESIEEVKDQKERILSQLEELYRQVEKMSCFDLGPDDGVRTNNPIKVRLEQLLDRIHDFLILESMTIREKTQNLYEEPLIEYTFNTLNRRLWAIQELHRTQAFLSPGNEAGRLDIILLNNDITTRMYDELLPRFLSDHLKAAEKAFGGFSKLKKTIVKQSPEMEEIIEKKVLPEKMSKAKASNIYANLSRLFSETLTVSVSHLLITEEFCRYAVSTGTYFNKVLQVCEGDKARELSTTVRDYIKNQYGDYMKMFQALKKRPYEINADPIADFNKKVEEWMKRKDIFQKKK